MSLLSVCLSDAICQAAYLSVSCQFVCLSLTVCSSNYLSLSIYLSSYLIVRFCIWFCLYIRPFLYLGLCLYFYFSFYLTIWKRSGMKLFFFFHSVLNFKISFRSVTVRIWWAGRGKARAWGGYWDKQSPDVLLRRISWVLLVGVSVGRLHLCLYRSLRITHSAFWTRVKMIRDSIFSFINK